METTSQKITTTSYYTHHTIALIKYAETDVEFSKSFAFYVRQKFTFQSNAHSDITPSNFITPTSQAVAIDTAVWLLGTLQKSTTQDGRNSIALLTTWAQNIEEPKSLIFGIVGVDIIGPTLGLVKSKKKKPKGMNLIVSNDFLTLSDKEKISITHKASQTRLAHELKLAGGDAYKLHPDTFDWCFSDHVTKAHVNGVKTFTATINLLNDQNLPHSIIKDEDKVLAISISPSVSDDVIDAVEATLIE